MSGPEFRDLFSDLAGAYASFRPRYPAELFDWLAHAAPDTAQVWEAGAGNGQASVDLAERFERVIATDASARQLEHAVAHPRVVYRVVHAEESGLPSSSCDLVVAAQALHWFVIPAFFAEARRVLSPGGLIAVWCYAEPRILKDRKSNAVLRKFGELVAPHWPAERAIVESGYRSVAFPFEEVAAPDFAMEHEMTREQLVGYLGTWSATRRLTAKSGDPVAAIERDLAEVWPDGTTRTLAWTLHLRAGRKGRDEVLS